MVYIGNDERHEPRTKNRRSSSDSWKYKSPWNKISHDVSDFFWRFSVVSYSYHVHILITRENGGHLPKWSYTVQTILTLHQGPLWKAASLCQLAAWSMDLLVPKMNMKLFTHWIYRKYYCNYCTKQAWIYTIELCTKDRNPVWLTWLLITKARLWAFFGCGSALFGRVHAARINGVSTIWNGPWALMPLEENQAVYGR